MPNRVPHAVIDFAVYLNGVELLGAVDATLPDFEYLTEPLEGAGIAGSADVPLAGLTKPLTLRLKWRTTTGDTGRLAAPKVHEIQLRSARQAVNAGTGRLEVDEMVVLANVMPKKPALGKVAPAKQMEAETELEVLAMRVIVANRELIDYDKLNYRCVIDGVDYLADVRAALGK